MPVLHAGQADGPRQHRQAALVGHSRRLAGRRSGVLRGDDAQLSRHVRELPVWFFNLPPPDDAPHRAGYGCGRDSGSRRCCRDSSTSGVEGSLDIDHRAGDGRLAARSMARESTPREPGHHQVALLARHARRAGRRHAGQQALADRADVERPCDGSRCSFRRPRSSRRRDSIGSRGRSAIGCCRCSCGGLVLVVARELCRFGCAIAGLLIWSMAAAAAVSARRDV